MADALEVPTVGVEEEFFLVAGDGPDLTPNAAEVLAALAGNDSAGEAETELLRPQVETGTGVHRGLDALERELRERRAGLAAAAARHGLRLAASGTAWLPPRAAEPFRDRVTPKDRYQRMAERFGPTATQQLVNGCHVHVGVPTREAAVGVAGRLGPWLAPLIALTANSPFWSGEDTAYASYRSQVWTRWPSAQTAVPFTSAAEYDATADALVAIGAALDDGMLYFTARPSSRYPTVELRVSDVCLTVEQAGVLAALARALVMRCLQEAAEGAPTPQLRAELVRAAEWRAARYGLGGALVDPASLARGKPVLAPAADVLEGLVDELAEFLSAAGDRERVRAGLQKLADDGNGAVQQRAAYQRRRSWDDLADAVVDATLAGCA